MTPHETEFVARCDALFASINRTYLGKIANFLNWPMEDMKQEFRLACWEAWSGHSAFDRSRGDLVGYFFGRARTLLYKRDGYRNFESISNPWNAEDEASNGKIRDAEPSALDVLIEREEQKETDATEQSWRLLCSFIEASMKNPRRRSPAWRLWRQGLSQSQIAEISGRTQSYISRVLKKELSKPSGPCEH